MTKKQDGRTAKIALLMRELGALSGEMSRAMEQAYIPHVAKGLMTLHMKEVMTRYYAWAKAAMEAGL